MLSHDTQRHKKEAGSENDAGQHGLAEPASFIVSISYMIRKMPRVSTDASSED